MSNRVRPDQAVESQRPRKVARIERTQEHQVRTTHRRRKVLTRLGVLAGFALAMVVYPVMGTITPYGNAAEALPDVVAGAAPSTARAILGGGPQLLSSDLPLPSVDDQASAILTSFEEPAGTALPDCVSSSHSSGSNGLLSSSDLCDLWVPGEKLRADAAVAFAALNEHYKSEFGHDICLSDSYRSLSNQYATKRARGYLAATPGTSMHGWGIAVDLCSDSSSGASKAWLDDNAGIYGWANPVWAQTSKYEPWHWEFTEAAASYYNEMWGTGY
ncbi:D-alanyl-D-alanine carboxypeptidase family protein [Demequina aurantiaca]|uniref:D-alanyl-D-alanine carboxypeptidase family protein n=1 Tax=Demequina aurantiaca TaxID=676200 RepID=UPI003D353E11